MTSTQDLSSVIRRYCEAKDESPGSLLVWRVGDFYELFHDDAKTAAKVLGLTLKCEVIDRNAVSRAGFPYHALEGYLPKLVRAGHRVAVRETSESDPHP